MGLAQSNPLGLLNQTHPKRRRISSLADATSAAPLPRALVAPHSHAVTLRQGTMRGKQRGWGARMGRAASGTMWMGDGDHIGDQISQGKRVDRQDWV